MNKNELLKEKRIHGLPETISQDEIKLLAKNVPIQKIIGFIDFDDLKINVNRKVLIPRYETQEVVNKALDYIRETDRVLDLCSGSGYIGLTIKHKMAHATVVLADIDNEAIIQSMENRELHDLEVEIIKSDLFENVKGKFNVIISNPPYIPTATILDNSVLMHEPDHALFAGADGNYFYDKIIKDVKKHIEIGGYLVFEISPDNTKFMQMNGFEIIKDINKKDRIAIKRY